MGMTLSYLFDSFKSPLPWSECKDSWNAVCVASVEKNTSPVISSSSIFNNISSVTALNISTQPKSSAELYFM